MYGGALFGVRLSFAQDLAGDRGGVTLAEEDVADEVHERVSFRPAEVAVRPLAPREYEREGIASAIPRVRITTAFTRTIARAFMPVS